MKLRELGRRRAACCGVVSAGDDGAVAAEFAVSLPAIVVVIVLAVGTLGACAQQVRLQDAVADAARLAARGESNERVDAAIAAAADGANGHIERRGDGLVCVTATVLTAVSIELSATGCALEGGW
ncbi:TadE family type IV pilus minor pilin (plasmid) [Coraliomargarita sp. W4R53]